MGQYNIYPNHVLIRPSMSRWTPQLFRSIGPIPSDWPCENIIANLPIPKCECNSVRMENIYIYIAVAEEVAHLLDGLNDQKWALMCKDQNSGRGGQNAT